MACLGAKNITVWFQEAELREQELHIPKDVLCVDRVWGFMPTHLYSSGTAERSAQVLCLDLWSFTILSLAKLGRELYSPI